MKTLNTIQTFSKIGKLLSKIIYICCIVGFIGCIVGIIAMLIGSHAAKISGTTLHSVLASEAGSSVGTLSVAIAAGLILSVGEFFVARMAYRYFSNELNAGTPFTLEGANELMHLGISVIWIPLVSIILTQIAQEVIAQFMENVELLSLDGYGSVMLGVAFIIMSLLCKCGAELVKSSSND